MVKLEQGPVDLRAQSRCFFAWRSLLSGSVLYGCLVSWGALANSSINTTILGGLDNAQWQACPESRLNGLQLSGFPLQIELAHLELNVACMGSATQPVQFDSLAQFKAPLEQLLSQFIRWTDALAVDSVSVQRLKLVLNSTSSIEGSLTLKQQAKQWQAQWRGDDGSHFTLQLRPRSKQFKLSGQVQPNLVKTLSALWPSLASAQAYGPLEFELNLADFEDLQLELQLRSPQLNAQVDAQLSAWENWQLAVNSSPIELEQWRLPASHWQLQAGHWQVDIKQWQVNGQGLWQLEPQLRVQGSLSSQQLPILQQSLYPLAGASELLSGAGQVDFSWQAKLLSGHVALDSLNALWGEQRLSEGRLSGDFSYRPKQGWQHSGNLHLHTWDVGIPLSDLSASWQQQQAAPLDELSSLQLTQASFSLLGGEAELSPFYFNFPSQAVVLLQHIQLAELAAIYPELGLAVTGSVSGRLPIELSQHGLAITAGELAVLEPAGKIRLSHQSLVAMKAQHPSLDFALSLLEDFDYETLAANVDFAEDGQLDMQVKLYGRNPKVSSRPVALNYRHQENIYQLLRSLRIGDQLSGQLQQWIDEHSARPSD